MLVDIDCAFERLQRGRLLIGLFLVTQMASRLDALCNIVCVATLCNRCNLVIIQKLRDFIPENTIGLPLAT